MFSHDSRVIPLTIAIQNTTHTLDQLIAQLTDSIRTLNIANMRAYQCAEVLEKHEPLSLLSL